MPKSNFCYFSWKQINQNKYKIKFHLYYCKNYSCSRMDTLECCWMDQICQRSLQFSHIFD